MNLKGGILFLLLICSQFLFAQDMNNLAIDGVVRDEGGGKIVGARIVLLQDGVETVREVSGRNGRFDLYLEFDHVFTIVISKANYVSKRIEVNTKNVPADEQAWGYEWPVSVELFKQIEGIDYSILKRPIGKIYYDANLQNFDSDKRYTKEIKSEIDKMEAAYAAKLKQEQNSLKQAEQDYKLAMRDANSALEDGDYDLARDNAQAALKLNAGSSEAKNLLARIESKASKDKEVDDAYKQAIAQAEAFLKEKEFDKAVASYEAALKAKPGEKYPQEKIRSAKAAKAEKIRLEKELTAKQKEELKFKQLIEKGDGAFDRQAYQEAKVHYQNARAIKEDEHAKNRIAEIDAALKEIAENERKLKEEKELRDAYDVKIEKADLAFNNKNYSVAKTHYEAAQKLISSEAYPGQRIAEIEQLVSEAEATAAAEKERERIELAYQNAIAKADRDFKNKDYKTAIDNYTEALEVKPDDAYAKEQIFKANEFIASEKTAKEQQIAAQKLETDYQSFMASGKQALQANKLEEAREAYTQAQGLKPNEKLPKEQLDLIAERLQAQQAQQAARAQYDEYISKGDAAMASENFEDAIGHYKMAQGVMSTERYPKDKIREAEQAILSRKQDEERALAAAAVEKQYSDLIAQADEHFNQERYDDAMGSYEAALKVKRNEDYPMVQIDKIKAKRREIELAEETARKEAAKQQRYDELIARADDQFGEEKYDQARETYNLAANVFPTESYPKDQVTKIDALLKQKADEASERERQLAEEKALAEKAKRYKEAVDKADLLFRSRDFNQAITAYQKAAEIDESNDYPRVQIELARERIAKAEREEEEKRAREEKETRYKVLIANGDAAIVSKNWDVAREAFTEASSLKPDEDLPKVKLSLIDELENRAKEDAELAKYKNSIYIADRAFLRGEYEAAIAEYNKALQIRPDEEHPKLRLAKIEEIKAFNAQDEQVDTNGPERRVEEEIIEEDRSTITIRRVIIGDKVDVYKKVVHVWGGKYFFLNEQPITELVFNRETTK